MSSVEIIKRKGLSVYLMEIDDNQTSGYFDSLTDVEKNKLTTIHHPAKRNEFLASRYLRTSVFGQKSILYYENGAPFIENQGFISLSHTNGLVGLAHSDAFSVGMDVECIREKAMRLHQKFMHHEEHSDFDATNAEDMTILWSMKETLYKLGHRKGIHFATELLVSKLKQDYAGSISHPDEIHTYPLFHHQHGHFIVTCNAGPPEIQHL